MTRQDWQAASDARGNAYLARLEAMRTLIGSYQSGMSGSSAVLALINQDRHAFWTVAAGRYLRQGRESFDARKDSSPTSRAEGERLLRLARKDADTCRAYADRNRAVEDLDILPILTTSEWSVQPADFD